MFFPDSNKHGVKTFVKGQPVLIPCEGEDVRWHNTETKSDPPQVPDKKVNNLMFQAITLDDAGTYECKNNVNNSVIKTIEVKVIPGKNGYLHVKKHL